MAFDHFASEYDDLVEDSIAFGRQHHDFYTRRKAEVLLDVVRRHLGAVTEQRVLDVGCGVGLTDRHLAGLFRGLYGVDTSREALRRASSANSSVGYCACSGDGLPFADQQFDLAFAVCVVHHVPPSAWQSFVDEIARVVRPGGLVLLLEHNPLNPLTRATVSRCPFDDEATLIGLRRAAQLLRAAGLAIAERRYIIFVPVDADWARHIDRSLSWLPMGAQFCVAGRRV